jgi:hypothetical protein
MNSPPDLSLNASQFVFLDQKGKRWSQVRAVSLIGSALLFVVLVAFVQSLLVLPKLRHPDALANPETGFRGSPQGPEAIPLSPSPPGWLKRKPGDGLKPVPARGSVASQEPVFLAFYSS